MVEKIDVKDIMNQDIEVFTDRVITRLRELVDENVLTETESLVCQGMVADCKVEKLNLYYGNAELDVFLYNECTHRRVATALGRSLVYDVRATSSHVNTGVELNSKPASADPNKLATSFKIERHRLIVNGNIITRGSLDKNVLSLYVPSNRLPK